jgi:hypothetical protein
LRFDRERSSSPFRPTRSWDVDAERWYLAQDLASMNALAKHGLVGGDPMPPDRAALLGEQAS